MIEYNHKTEMPEVGYMEPVNYEKRGYLLENFRLFHLDTSIQEDMDFHYHEFHKLVFFRSGAGRYLVEGRSYVLRPNDIILVQRGAIHKAQISPEETYERVILYISPAFLERLSTEDSRLDYCFSAAAREKSFVLRPDYSRRERMNQILTNLEHTTRGEGYGQDLLAQALLMQLLVELARGVGAEHYQYAVAENSGEKVTEILEYLHDHLTEPISIDSLAEHFYLSKYYMMRLFRARTGFTIHAYLTDQRLHLAQELIRQGAIATEACYRCGYGDYSAFSRAYKKRFGESPARGRERP